MSDEAPWQHLPHDPVAFFGLDEGFDRKDLKRAYSRLIRKYKPERAPEEFQRIRAAFEDLDDRLRYGRPMEMRGVSLDLPVEPIAQDLDDAPEPEPIPPSPALDAGTHVRDEGAAALRARLEAEVGEDTRTWCALALLDGALEDDRLAPFRRLLDGFEKAREPRVLASLFEQLARASMEPKDAKAFIELMSDAVAAGRGRTVHLENGFWFLTELHWLLLARRAEPGSFQRFFDQVRTRLSGEVSHGEPVVLVRLFRCLCLRGDDAWLDGLAQDLQDDHWRAPDWIQQEFDLADWLARYRFVREAFASGDPLRELMDEAIVAIIEEDEVAADRAFLRAQVECASRPDELLATFPVNRDGEPGVPAGTVPLEILHWYGSEWRERWSTDDDESESARARRALEFSRRLDRRTDRSVAGWLWHLVFLGTLALGTAAGGAIGILLKPMIGDIGAYAVAGALIGALWVALFTGKLWRIVVWMSRPFSWHQHRRLWRPMVASFLQEHHMGVDELMESFMEEDSPAGYHEIFYVSHDQGLRALGEAVRVARE